MPGQVVELGGCIQESLHPFFVDHSFQGLLFAGLGFLPSVQRVEFKPSAPSPFKGQVRGRFPGIGIQIPNLIESLGRTELDKQILHQISCGMLTPRQLGQMAVQAMSVLVQKQQQSVIP